MDVDATGSNIAEIPLGIVFEIIGHGYPERLLAPLQIVLVDDSGNGAALAHTSTVADEEAGSAAVGQEVVVGLGGVRNGLQLEGAQLATVDGLGGNG